MPGRMSCFRRTGRAPGDESCLRLRQQGLPIDPAVYTVQDLEKELLAVRERRCGMLKDITLGQYFPGDTVAHRLDPRTKILLVTLYIIALFCAKSIVTYALLALVLAVCVRISKVGIRSPGVGALSRCCSLLFSPAF